MNPAPPTLPTRLRVRALFISDLHLGSRHCQAAALVDFLQRVQCDRLYLVGDIIDLWWMSRRRAAFCAQQKEVFEIIRDMARAGTSIVYVPGNHDRPLRELCGLSLPRVRVRRRAIHRMLDGRRLLVTHGDEFDVEVRIGRVAHWLGDHLYTGILSGNRILNRLRRALGMRYFSLADMLKRRSGAAERYIARFVDACVADAKRRGVDGIVCGHIHRPDLIERDGIVYANDGDWVESLSALGEMRDGSLMLLRWRSAEDAPVAEPLTAGPAAALPLAA